MTKELYNQALSVYEQLTPYYSTVEEQLLLVYEHKAFEAYFQCFNIDLSIDQTKMSNFLAMNGSLTQQTMCSYTAQPKSLFTLLLCDTAEQLVVQDSKSSAIKLLFPQITIDPLNPVRYAKLSTLPLRDVLCTHILSDDGTTLIPLKHLTMIADEAYCPAVDLEWRCHPYGVGTYLLPSEISRLWQHSTESKNLHAKLQDVLTFEHPNLLSTLKKLCAALEANDAHGGNGSQDEAGESAYQAIYQFFNFYNALSDEARQQIPKKINDELKLLLELSTPDKNRIDNKDNLESCIGTRVEQLKSAIIEENNRAVLQAISLSDVQINISKTQVMTDYLTSRADFERRLTQNDYSGQDKQGCTQRLFQWLNCLNASIDLEFAMSAPQVLFENIVTEYPSIFLKYKNVESLLNVLLSEHEHSKIEIALAHILKDTSLLSLQTINAYLTEKQGFIAERQAILLCCALIKSEKIGNLVHLQTYLKLFDEPMSLKLLAAINEQSLWDSLLVPTAKDCPLFTQDLDENSPLQHSLLLMMKNRLPAADSMNLHLSYLRASVYIKLKLYDEAVLVDLNACLKYKPSWQLFTHRARIYIHLGQTECALNDFEQAHRLGSEDCPSYDFMGQYYWQSGKIDEANAYLTRAIELNSKSWRTYYARAQINAHSQRTQHALADINEVYAQLSTQLATGALSVAAQSQMTIQQIPPKTLAKETSKRKITIDQDTTLRIPATYISPCSQTFVANDQQLVQLVQLPANYNLSILFNPALASLYQQTRMDTGGISNSDAIAHISNIDGDFLFILDAKTFLQSVAYGDQKKAEALLTKNENQAAKLLQTTNIPFTDYSGRIFNCTAYEYAYWAKDTHMCVMLAKYIKPDETTRRIIYERIQQMREPVSTEVAPNFFTAASPRGLRYFTYNLQGELLEHVELHFDLNPLKNALQEYLDSKASLEKKDEIWIKKVGLAQRNVPAHIAQEYCQKRGFADLCANTTLADCFESNNLTRVFDFHDRGSDKKESWFVPNFYLQNNGLGITFALVRGKNTLTANESGIDLTDNSAKTSDPFMLFSQLRTFTGKESGTDVIKHPAIDLDAIKIIDQLRTAELTQLLHQLSLRLDAPIDDLFYSVPR